MVSRTSRRTLCGLRPSSHSRFGSHPNLIAEKIAPFFSSTYVEPILQPFCFHIHACNGGVYPPSSTFGRSNLQIEAQLQLWSGDPDPVGTFRRVSDLSPLFSYSCALFCAFLHAAKTQVFSFQAFPHSLPKIPGVGVPPSLEEEQNETTDCQFRVLSVRRTHRTTGGRQALSVGMAGGKERAREKIRGWVAGK